uniref:Uncharacterized protein n=1 Tax=Ciona savignyi TaxID=51511 RepID=H2YGK0_CIOSA
MKAFIIISNVLLSIELTLNLVGCIFCSIYYLGVHKMRTYTAHAYPAAAKVLCCCCYSDETVKEWLPIRPEWTVCKQAETSEIFFLTKKQLISFQQMYSTVVRNDRNKGRMIECFIDDKCKIFYAPRSKLRKLSVRLNDNSGSISRPRATRQVDVIDQPTGHTVVSIHLQSTSIDTPTSDPTVQTTALHTKIDKPVVKPRSKSIKSEQTIPVRPPTNCKYWMKWKAGLKLGFNFIDTLILQFIFFYHGAL